MKVAAWTVMGIALLVAGILMTLYSGYAQEAIKDRLVAKLNSKPGMEVRLDYLRLKFPLRLQIEGLRLVQDGDTMVAARSLTADVALMPLLAGDVKISEASLSDGRYQMGNADSLMQMVVTAGAMTIKPASVGLNDLAIDIADGSLSDATVDLTLRVDTTAADTTVATEASPMTITLERLKIDNLTYRMRMLPTIDSLGATVRSGILRQGKIDMSRQSVRLGAFTGSGLQAQYIAPDSATIAATPVAPASESTSPPWTVEIDSIHFTNSRGLYTTRGIVPEPGLDFGYICADSLDLSIKDFYNQATSIRLPISLHGRERCGVWLDATGTFAMDSAMMYFNEFNISTPNNTVLSADGHLGMGDMLTDRALPMRLQTRGDAAVADLRLMFPYLTPYMAGMRPSEVVKLNTLLDGTPAHLDVSPLDIGLNGCVNMRARGYLTDVFSPDDIGGDMDITGNIIDVKSILHAMLAPDAGISVPPMSLDGHVNVRSGLIAAEIQAHTRDGELALDGHLDIHAEGYDLSLTTDRFPVAAFMPSLGVGNVTADVSASGKGFDLFSPETSLMTDATIHSLYYEGYNYRDIGIKAAIEAGVAKVDAESHTNDLDIGLTAEGNLAGDTYDWTANLNGRQIDLHALGFMDNPAVLSVDLDGSASISPRANSIEAKLRIPHLHLREDVGDIDITDVDGHFSTNDSLTSVKIHNRDLTASAFSPSPLDTLMARADTAMSVAMRQVQERKVDVGELQKALPKFTIDVTAGADNMINDILAESKMSIRHMNLSAGNDSVLSLTSGILGVNTGTVTIDTIRVDMTQRKEKLHILARMDNAAGNMDQWAHVSVDGMLNTDRLGLRLTQQNSQMKTGFDIGAITVLEDSALRARFFPLTPMIGYKKWMVNADNYIYYNFATRHIDANLHMQGDDSSLAIYTEHPAGADHHEEGEVQEDIVLQLTDIHIQDWIQINPFAPPMKGDLSANMRLNWDGGENINGQGKVSLDDFYYDRQRVATLEADLKVNTNTSGLVRASADLMIDGRKTMTLQGALNDTTATSPFNLDFSMIRFPLATVNPFLPAGVGRLSGVLNGTMDVSGNSEHPVLNGYINFDSTEVRLAMTGTTYRFSDVKIPVDSNMVRLTDFRISGTNENPLSINGHVDIRSLANPGVNLSLTADNMMIVNTDRAPRGADIFGKAYIDLDAKIRGNMRLMNVDADLSLLRGTNVTYVMPEATSEIASHTTDGMVKFVNFRDTTAVVDADTINESAMLMNINAILNIERGTTVNVYLSTDGSDRVKVVSDGQLNYTQTPVSDGRLTGRLNINSGYARYTLPVINAEKLFNFVEGSYVAFNGDMFNPVLNIHATDPVKANVTQEGQNSRLVDFNILLGVTGTLAQMDVKFDLTTNDDLTVANELQSMSAEQRANKAMNMLLYNMYTGPGTKASANLSANPLFSFLESQLNSWAANNIKGVDISFGIDQYNQTTDGRTSSTMSYSYQVSKSLFNDRFKIVVGGNYTTDANADENFSQNLINDISFEYYLNKQQTMLLKIFRHTGYESILEGEVTQTGVGFVYKRKLSHLSQILPRFMRPRRHRYITIERK